PALEVGHPAALDLACFPHDLFLDVGLRYAELGHDVAIDEALDRISLNDRAEPEFGLIRRADLADQDDVERRLEPFSDLIAHREAAARQRKHHRTSILVDQELRRKPAPRI